MTSLPLEQRIKRIALLSGGSVSQVTVFDLKFLSTTSCYAEKGGMNLVIPPRELCDLSYLSALCSRHNMAVLPPVSLASAESPALTLDRNGALSVFVGRPPCAQPGKDISIFRPMNGGEETVDVSIITQLLVPIIEAREADGTAIFDAFGDCFRRKFKEPNEIIMVCVDCSSSMVSLCEFSVSVNDILRRISACALLFKICSASRTTLALFISVCTVDTDFELVYSPKIPISLKFRTIQMNRRMSSRWTAMTTAKAQFPSLQTALHSCALQLMR